MANDYYLFCLFCRDIVYIYFLRIANVQNYLSLQMMTRPRVVKFYNNFHANFLTTGKKYNLLT